jgi:LacI family transcriptional regulator
MLTKHLVNKGCKKIVILTTNPHLTTMNQRKKGFEDALRDSGITISPNLLGVVNFDEYEKNIYKVLNNIFKNVPDVDGFFFTTHILALEAFQYFNDKGIKPDFEFASIHEAPVFKILAPRINVARMPIEDIGKNAVNLLIEQIDSIRKNRKRKFDTKHMILSCSLEFRS